MSSEYIVEVSESDFQQQVLAFSNQTPVIVDFWAEWCAPCRMLGPLLEKLAKEGAGAFRLAKVNVDENPNLSMQYDVRSIPAVKAFRNGRVVDEFLGALPEIQVRDFLRRIAPNPGDLILEKGQGLLNMGKWSNAAASFRGVLKSKPDHSEALLGLTKSLLAQGLTSEALPILREFPASKEFSVAEQLLPLAEALANVELEEEDENDEPLEAAFKHALELVSLGNVPAAIDGTLDVLREDKNFGEGKAHQVILGMLEMLGDDNPQTRAYRSELASLLF